MPTKKKKKNRSQRRVSMEAVERTASSWETMVGSAVTGVLGEAVISLKDYADIKIAEYGPKYVKKASKQVAKASKDIVEWTKDHPVKLAAGAAALLAVSAFLHATMHPSSEPKKTSSQA